MPVLENSKGKQPVHDLSMGREKQKCEPAETWKKPSSGWAKLNSDGSFSESGCSGAWGAVLRNELGDVILTAWGPAQYLICPNLVTAESLGLHYGIRAILPVFAGPVQIKSDNAFLVNELENTGSWKFLIADTLRDNKLALCSFPDFSAKEIN